MTKTFDIRHLLALIQSFAFFFHQGRWKLTTKLTKDTKNLPLAGSRAAPAKFKRHV